MKKTLLAGAALASLWTVGSAQAADLQRPVYKAPPPAAAVVFSWTGFYLGGHIGWSQIRDTQNMSSPTFAVSFSNNASGVQGGVHGGYNWQVNQFVLGLEADFDGNSINKTFPLPAPLGGETNTDQLRWQGSLRGRGGIAVDRTLLYVTGGWAYGRFSDTYNAPGTVFNQTVGSNRDGWTAGGGVEYAFTNNIIGRIEYRYTDWGSHTNNLNVFLAPPGTSVDHVTENNVNVGLSYKFGM